MKQFDDLQQILVDKNVGSRAVALLGEIEAVLEDVQSELDERPTDDEYDELEKKVQNQEQFTKLMEVFADHANWDGNTFTPQDRTFSIWSPDEMADKVLRGVKITA